MNVDFGDMSRVECQWQASIAVAWKGRGNVHSRHTESIKFDLVVPDQIAYRRV